MILIGDAGGSKTDWRLIDSQTIHQFSSPAFNLTTHPIDPFLANLPVDIFNHKEDIRKVYLYVAGYTQQEAGELLINKMSELLEASVFLAADTLGVARALFGNEKGNVCLLGTGAGAVFFDGKHIASRVPSLGYVLGDEGSGVHLGKSVLAAYLRNQLPLDLHEMFEEQYGTIIESGVLERVYRQPLANHYLAQFASFVVDYQRHDYLNRLIESCFKEYFEAFFPDKLSNPGEAFRFSGSIAYLLSNPLRQVASRFHIHIDKIIQAPVAGLALYHQKYG